jgi:ribosomal 50S subunit-recycling heat shock protein
MRLDDFLSTVGIIKRRTEAKQMCQNGLVELNGRKSKPAHEVKPNDIIRIKGSSPQTIEILNIPSGSIPKDSRSNFVKDLPV